MVKIFRTFRWKGLQDGKVRNYIFYAIGEIFLVVVGILIALSINNWNNEKELRKAEKQIYKNVLKKIREDRSDIVGNMYFNDSIMAQFQYASQIIESNDRAQIDTLKVFLFSQFEYSDFSGSDDIYQNLVNSGELKLLKNEQIVGELQELEEDLIYMNRLESNHWEVIMRFVGPGLIDNVHISNLEVERPDDLYSFQMHNLLFAMMSIMSEKDDVYKATIAQIDAVSELINQELNQ